MAQRTLFEYVPDDDPLFRPYTESFQIRTHGPHVEVSYGQRDETSSQSWQTKVAADNLDALAWALRQEEFLGAQVKDAAFGVLGPEKVRATQDAPRSYDGGLIVRVNQRIVTLYPAQGTDRPEARLPREQALLAADAIQKWLAERRRGDLARGGMIGASTADNRPQGGRLVDRIVAAGERLDADRLRKVTGAVPRRGAFTLPAVVEAAGDRMREWGYDVDRYGVVESMLRVIDLFQKSTTAAGTPDVHEAWARAQGEAVDRQDGFDRRGGTGGGEYETLQSQVDRLAQCILDNIDGEPSQGEGAVDTAIRLLRELAKRRTVEAGLLGSVQTEDILAFQRGWEDADRAQRATPDAPREQGARTLCGLIDVFERRRRAAAEGADVRPAPSREDLVKDQEQWYGEAMRLVDGVDALIVRGALLSAASVIAPADLDAHDRRGYLLALRDVSRHIVTRLRAGASDTPGMDALVDMMNPPKVTASAGEGAGISADTLRRAEDLVNAQQDEPEPASWAHLEKAFADAMRRPLDRRLFLGQEYEDGTKGLDEDDDVDDIDDEGSVLPPDAQARADAWGYATSLLHRVDPPAAAGRWGMQAGAAAADGQTPLADYVEQVTRLAEWLTGPVPQFRAVTKREGRSPAAWITDADAPPLLPECGDPECPACTDAPGEDVPDEDAQTGDGEDASEPSAVGTQKCEHECGHPMTKSVLDDVTVKRSTVDGRPVIQVGPRGHVHLHSVDVTPRERREAPKSFLDVVLDTIVESAAAATRKARERAERDAAAEAPADGSAGLAESIAAEEGDVPTNSPGGQTWQKRRDAVADRGEDITEEKPQEG